MAHEVSDLCRSRSARGCMLSVTTVIGPYVFRQNASQRGTGARSASERFSRLALLFLPLESSV